jgi:hypothetical protein
MSDGGKGDARRPLAVSEEQFNANWDSIFKKPVKTYAGGEPHLVTEVKPKRKMIDPPSGWKYGFPKEIPEDVENTRDWLIQNGYPQAEIDKLGDSFFVRGWWA